MMSSFLLVMPGFVVKSAQGDTEKLITDISANGPMIAALQFVGESIVPDQNCGNCQLYKAGEGSTGKCQLFVSGNVPKDGWCISWAKKVALY